MTYKQIRVDFVCVPLSGHLNPQVELALHLQKNKHYQIRFITGESQHKFLNDLGFETISFLEDEPDAIERAAEFEQQSNSSIQEMLKLFNKSIKLIERTYPYILNALQMNQTDIVVSDFITLSGGIAAQNLNIPWITTHPSLFVVEALAGTPSYLGGWMPKENMLGSVRDWFGWRFVRTIKKSVGILSRRSFDLMKFNLYKDGKENLYSPYSILGLGMKELEFNQDFPEQFVFAGPCCLATQDDVSLVFPQQFKSNVLITIGTLLKWVQKDIIDLISQLALNHPDILFVFTLGSSSQRFEEAQQVSDNFWIYPFIPYESHLPEFDYVIHQAGAGIFYQCIRHNIPSLMIPQDNDQFDFAARGHLAETGIWVKGDSIDALQVGFNQLINTKKWDNLQIMHEAYHTYRPGQVLESEIQRLVSRFRKSEN